MGEPFCTPISDDRISFLSADRSYVALPGALEEESYNKDLQATHADDHGALDHAKVGDSLLRAADSAEVAVLPCSKVLLVSSNGRKLSGDLVDGLLQSRGLLGAGALLGGELCANFVLDL